jgi:hypothetical protein
MSNDCSDILVLQAEDSSLTAIEKIAWEYVRNDRSSRSSSAGAALPVGEIIARFTGAITRDDETSLRGYFEKDSFLAISVVRRYIKDEQIEAWIKCMNGNKAGLSVVGETDDRNLISFTLMFNGNLDSVAKATVVVHGGKILGKKPADRETLTIRPGGGMPITIQRDGEKTVVVEIESDQAKGMPLIFPLPSYAEPTGVLIGEGAFEAFTVTLQKAGKVRVVAEYTATPFKGGATVCVYVFVDDPDNTFVGNCEGFSGSAATVRAEKTAVLEKGVHRIWAKTSETNAQFNSFRVRVYW